MRRVLLVAAAAYLGWAWLGVYVERADGLRGDRSYRSMLNYPPGKGIA